MGSPLSPIVANIFMEDFEAWALKTSPWKPKMWCRYVDDVLLIWPHEEQWLEEFHHHLNGLNPSIQFTVKKETEGRIAILDVQPEKRVTKGHTSVFHKKTHMDRYFNFDSNNPARVKKGIIQCLRHRAEKVCDGSMKWQEIEHLRQVFRANEYPEAMIKGTLEADPHRLTHPKPVRHPPSCCSSRTSLDSVRGLKWHANHWE